MLNSFQAEGIVALPGLKEPVTGLRDEKGMAYIYASSMEDAIMAHGFVTAQKRSIILCAQVDSESGLSLVEKKSL